MAEFIELTKVLKTDACFGDTFTLWDKHVDDFLIEEPLEMLSLGLSID